MWKALRIVVLLLILATVGQSLWLGQKRATAWQDPLRVAIYPINADASAASAAYLKSLTVDAFSPIAAYMDDESARYGLHLRRSLDIVLAPPVASLPPPAPPRAGPLEAVVWSLRLRYWAWRNDDVPGFRPQVRLFVLFFDPQQRASLPHSTALQKGLIGIVNAFASASLAGTNRVVVAHEMLHTLGATDKYDPASNLPIHPQGYAEPERRPLHPQDFAEIMGGRIPVGEGQAEIPQSLSATLIGPQTAAEIGWQPRR